MTEIKTNSDLIGQVQIADEVIAIIAGTAALEVEGVVATGGNMSNEFAGIIGKKNFSKGVRVNVVDGDVSVVIGLSVKFGFKVQEIAYEVQRRVKNAIETMTGLNVLDVDVSVLAVNFDKDKNNA
ncbi:MAG: Asp23/Gls24 family envelope stress response protein [Clostridiales bacterium]|jgi:uncharacterized alkaline shock family protein YloU|nr:Asp23/Gls24 family envelope stress response protein [Clostridiales bacterium]